MYLSEVILISEDVKKKYRMSPSQSLYLSLTLRIFKEKKVSANKNILNEYYKKRTLLREKNQQKLCSP